MISFLAFSHTLHFTSLLGPQSRLRILGVIRTCDRLVMEQICLDGVAYEFMSKSPFYTTGQNQVHTFPRPGMAWVGVGGGGWGVSFLILQILGGFIQDSDGLGRSGHQSA